MIYIIPLVCVYLNGFIYFLALLSTVVGGGAPLPFCVSVMALGPAHSGCLNAEEWARHPEVLSVNKTLQLPTVIAWALFTNAKCCKCRIIIFLQPKKGCNLPEVTWKVKDELGSESRSPDHQTKLFTKLSCPQRLKSCFLLIMATLPKTARTCIALTPCQAHFRNASHTFIHIILKQLYELCTVTISILDAEANAQKDTCLRSHPAVK